MTRVKRLIKQPAAAFTFATLATLAGLLARSCHPASEAMMIPLCSGQTMTLESGQSVVMHCAGCYTALFGMIGMVFTGIWAAVRNRF